MGPEEPSLLLAKRDLSYARFDRSDLHRADLREANLSGASLNGANLRKARMGCVVDVRGKKPCTLLTGASLQEARLEKAHLARADLSEADLSRANLQEVDLSDAYLEGAKLGTALLGANLDGAALLGANLDGADLLGANLSYADLRGASLHGALLQGASLRGVRLEGASLSEANLQGANLWGARLQGIALNSAKIWQTWAPKSDTKWADMRDVNLNAPSSDQRQALQTKVEGIADEKLRQRIKQEVAPLLNEVKAKEWENSDAHKAWREIARVSLIDDDKKRAGLSDYLASLACTDDSDAGWIAQGILARAIRYDGTIEDVLPEIVGDTDVQKDRARIVELGGRGRVWTGNGTMSYSFNGDPARLYVRLTEPDCRVAAKLQEYVPGNLNRLEKEKAIDANYFEGASGD
jgi:uncharacterized protein YjbI with pentapeptide repeats